MPEFKRKRYRFKNYDYSSDGAYFVTICTADKVCSLASVDPETFTARLTKLGKLVSDTVAQLPSVFEGITIPDYVIMPNHMHMIILLKGESKTLSKIINYLKGHVSWKAGQSVWQKSFYEHIIRDEDDYLRISEYIELNPRKWATDMYYRQT